MIEKISIHNFKNIADEELPLSALTVVSGCNSTGKSTLLQAILALATENRPNSPYADYMPDLDKHRNRYVNAKEISIGCETEGHKLKMTINDKGTSSESLDKLSLEKNLYYLSANRNGFFKNEKSYKDMISGPDGMALIGTFNDEKSRSLDKELIKDTTSYTLGSQVNWWLTYILGISQEINTEGRADRNIEVNYKSSEIPNVLPSQLGVGVSYLARVIILCLRSEKGSTIMVENPEIHLYPLAQSRLAEFLTFVANSGRQLIIETHSDTLLTKFRHEVYKGNLSPEKLEVLFKTGITDNFLILTVSRNGRWKNDFPRGFFDASLNDLLEMN